jgi:activator of 2-hydroxyglutaryl-CoA dehydratase
MLGARHFVPNVDTILEIGGQDSKFISLRNGSIADFAMNKICAAGTGSFLEAERAS